MVTLEQLQALVEQAMAQDIPAAQLLDPLLMPMDSPASDYPLVNIPETSAVYFKNGNPVRTAGAPLQGLVRVTEGEEGSFSVWVRLTMKAAWRRVVWWSNTQLRAVLAIKAGCG
jgi:tRNA pseudouridine55 synthase